MRRVLLIAVPLLLLVAAAAYLSFQSSKAFKAPPIALKSDSPYRLGPDRRFLLAVSEAPRLLAAIQQPGKRPSYSDEAVRAEFDADGWRVYCGAELVGNLPEFPDFGEMIELLTKWVLRKAQAEDIKLTPAEGRKAEVAAALSQLNVIEALKRIDREWKANGPDTALVREAARSSVLLSAVPDEVGLGDLTPARALAWLAVSGALAPPALTRETCLLAVLMDYTGFASTRSDLLPANDPVRHFARNEEKELGRLASGPEDREVHLLWLLRLARSGSSAEWAAHLTGTNEAARQLSLLEAGTGLPLRSLDTDEMVAAAVLACLLEELHSGGTAGPRKGSIQAVEAAIDEACAGKTGPLLDEDLLKTYFHTAFYSALHLLGYHQLKIYSSVEASQAFAKMLAEKDLPPLAEDFRQWHAALAESKAGARNLVQLQSLLQSDSRFGTPLRQLAYEAVSDALPFGSPALRSQTLDFLRHLDTRLDDRLEAASLARDPLCALTFSERLWASIDECAGPARPLLQAWHASLTGDRTRLETILTTYPMTPWEKASLLSSLAGGEVVDDKLVETQLAALCRDSREWDVLAKYVDFLLERKRFREVIEAIESWLPTGKTEHGLDMTVARTRLARAYEGSGEFELALRRLEDPSVDQWQLGAMRQRALLLGRLERWDEALRLARDARGRYPDGIMSLLTEVQLLWRNREYEKAALELTSWPYPLQAGSWRFEVGPRFVECFSEDPREAIKAATALIKTRKAPPENVYGLAFEIGKGSPEAAFEILSRVPTQGLRRLESLTLAYTYLKKARDKSAALEWIRARLSEGEKLPLCVFAHQMKAEELLWDMAPAALSGEEGECYWLLRAAGSLKRPVGADQTALLRKHFETTGTSHYHTFGRFLLDRDSRAAVLATGVDPKKKCEGFYYLGFREQTAGRYNQAADCYLQCLDTGQQQVTEFRWAHDQLVIWRSGWKSLARLAREDRGRQTAQ